MKAQNVPLGEKEYLNTQEAIKYWNLSRRKFYAFLKKGVYSFIAYYGKRKLILRVAFDKYLLENPIVKEELVNGKGADKKGF